MIDNACCQNSLDWRGLCLSMAQRRIMRAKTERRSLGARGAPEFGPSLACASILIIGDDGTSSPTRTRHRVHSCTGRYGCKHDAPCRLAPHMAYTFSCRCAPTAAHRTTAFRHSVGGFARRAPRATAVVGALGNAANGNWEFRPGYFSKTAHASLRGAG